MVQYKLKAQTMFLVLHKQVDIPVCILREETHSGPTFRASGRPGRQTFYQQTRKGLKQ